MTGHNESRAELVRAPAEKKAWHQDRMEVIDYGRWLDEMGYLAPNDVWHYLEHPDRYAEWRNEWIHTEFGDQRADYGLDMDLERRGHAA